MRLDIKADVTHHIFEHPTNKELLMANAALSTALSDATSVVSTLRSENTSLSSALSVAEASGSSGAVSTAVDEEDTAVAGEIQSAIA